MNIDDTKKVFEEHFALLPPVVQDAITSSTVEENLRKLSNKYRLHLDQWQLLETEVLMTLMGLKDVDDLAKNIQSEVHVDTNTASALAQDISEVVFVPIRKELDATLTKFQPLVAVGDPLPDLSDAIQKTAHATSSSFSPPVDTYTKPIEKAVTDEVLHFSSASSVSPVLAQPTPTEAPTPSEKPKVVRTEVPETYKLGTQSGERKDVHTDPYRVPPDA